MYNVQCNMYNVQLHMTYKHRSTPSLQDHPYPLALTWKGGPVTTVPSHNIFKFIRIFIRICSCYVTSTQVAIPPNTAVGALCSMQYAVCILVPGNKHPVAPHKQAHNQRKSSTATVLLDDRTTVPSSGQTPAIPSKCHGTTTAEPIQCTASTSTSTSTYMYV